MASTLIIADNGKVYCVTLGSSGQVVELDAGDKEYPDRSATAVAAQEMVNEGVQVAEIPSPTQQQGAQAAIIMGTFVNLALLGDDTSGSKAD